MKFDEKYIKGVSAFAVTVLCVATFIVSYALAEVMIINMTYRTIVIAVVFCYIIVKVLKIIKDEIKYPLRATLKVVISTLILMRPLVSDDWVYLLYVVILGITMFITLPIYRDVVTELEHKYK